MNIRRQKSARKARTVTKKHRRTTGSDRMLHHPPGGISVRKGPLQKNGPPTESSPSRKNHERLPHLKRSRWHLLVGVLERTAILPVVRRKAHLRPGLPRRNAITKHNAIPHQSPIPSAVSCGRRFKMPEAQRRCLYFSGRWCKRWRR